MGRTEVGIADYIVAVGRLDARDPELRRRIAGLLGLAAPLPTLPDSTEPPVEPVGQKRPTPPPVVKNLEVADPPAPQVAPTAEAPLRVEPLDPERVELTWPDDPPAGLDSSDVLGTRPLVPPLLKPRLERGIVQLLLASERPGGELDLDAALAACARLELRSPLPTRLEWTVHGGADLLVDVSTALAPYADDVDRLIGLAEHVGGEATRILYYEHCPGRGVFSEELEFGAYRPERRRAVVVGAFGSGPAPASAGPLEWRMALWEMSEHAEIVGVCPFEAGRATFADVVPMVPWSEATTTNIVARVLGAWEWSRSTS